MLIRIARIVDHHFSYQEMKVRLAKGQTCQQVAPYTRLAQVYDQIMNHVNYRRWAKYIAAILKREGLGPEQKMLDIGCGTGRFLIEMQCLGFMGDGCDPSRAMLQVAGKHLAPGRLYVSTLPDMQNIAIRRYQIMTCLYDTMNYLTEEQLFEKSLQNIFMKLPPGGIFIFDLVSRTHCEHYFQNYSDSEVLSKQLAYSRESYFDVQQSLQINWLRIYTPEGVFEEIHHQKIYDFEQIESIIRLKTNFMLLGIYDEFSFSTANSRSGRAHFVLRKQ